MKLLILTQTVDKNDSSLGFFHKWLEEFAKRFEAIEVVTLGVGSRDLPSNVRVNSLGKESLKHSPLKRLHYTWRLYTYVFGLRHSYDAVFVHMNEEYVILAGIFWKLLRKKVYLWRNHPNGSFWTRIAVALVRTVFCVSEFAYVNYSPKAKVMPAGIDMDMFRDMNGRRENAVLSLGRLSPVKKLETIIGAFDGSLMPPLHIYGSTPARDREYADSMRALVQEKHLTNAVTFSPGISYTETPSVYNRYAMYVNATPTGSFDKAILEAAACGCIPIVSNKSFAGKLPKECLFGEGDSTDLAAKIRFLAAQSDAVRTSLKNACSSFVEREQSLTRLMELLSHEITS